MLYENIKIRNIYLNNMFFKHGHTFPIHKIHFLMPYTLWCIIILIFTYILLKNIKWRGRLELMML